MLDSSVVPRHLSHQGKHLRLSLPLNDDRCEDTQPLELLAGCTQSELSLPLGIQTVDIFPDTGDEKDMRVVCSISDRVQWEQRVRQVKERKLQELGVGLVSNIDYNAPLLQKTTNFAPVLSTRPVQFTGLHTPAVSTDAVLAEGLQADLPYHVKSRTTPDAVIHSDLNAQSIAANVAFLRAKHHELSKSVSELAQSGGLAFHGRSLSQREILHDKLSKIAPVRVRRTESLAINGIEPIKEEEIEETSPANEPVEPDMGSKFFVHTAPSASAVGLSNLHQHLASHDMSELIKTQAAPRNPLQGDLYMPDFDNEYETFRWADEPLEPSSQLFYEGNLSVFDHDYAYQCNQLPASSFIPPDMQMHLPLQAQHFTPYFSSYGGPHIQDTSLPQKLQAAMQSTSDPEFCVHAANRSSFNLQAEEFVPFSKAVVRPPAESQAIPIVRPSEAFQDQVEDDRNSAISPEIDTPQRLRNEASMRFDAYDGFDSGSESSLIDDRSSVACGADDQTKSDSNEERVKSFKFPSPVKPCTPSRSRTGLFVSPSPDEREYRSFPILAPLHLASTPRKSPPKIFQKSVELEDTELDSIIMDLSVREIITRDSTVGESTISEDDHEDDYDDSDDKPDERPRNTGGSRRVSSAKLILSHEDADMGLLLDAMLSAKFAGVTDLLNSIQLSLGSVDAQMQSSTMGEKLSEQLRNTIRQDFKSLLEEQACTERNSQLDLVSTVETGLDKATEDFRKDGPPIEAAKRSSREEEERIRVLVGAKTGLQRSVGELTAKAARLEGQLLDSTTFCSALQSQYSTSELAVTKLRKDLRDVQIDRDQAKLETENLSAQYTRLREHLEDTATQIADEQSRWRDSELEKDAKIEYLQRRLSEEERKVVDASTRRSSTTSVTTSVNDVQLTQFLMDRIKALELSCRHLQASHRDDLQAREARLDNLLQDWKQMTHDLNKAEGIIHGLRAEIAVNSAEVEDRLSRQSRTIDGPGTKHIMPDQAMECSVLKRSKSDSEVRNDFLADRAIIQLTTQLREKDARIAELEELLKKPAESTERQILCAVSENISLPAQDISDLPEEANTLPLKSRVAELKRMRISWELKHSTSGQTPSQSECAQ